MEGLWQDLRYAMRQLLAEKGFAAAAILTFALGIGATAAMFTVVNAVLLSALPYREPGRLVMLQGTFEEDGEVKPWSVSQRDFADWRAQSKSFSSISIWGNLAFNLEQGDQSRRLEGELVNHDYLSMLGLEPALGRFFVAEEDSRPLERYVVVLGHDLWRTTFGADRGILGRKLPMNGKLYEVVGVGPRDFHGLSDKADLWVPSMLPPVRPWLEVRGRRWAAGAARLAPGVTVEQAERELAGITRILAEENPASNQGIGAQVTPFTDYWFGKLRVGLLILTVGAGILLLIACINVASLLLTRAAARQRVVALQVALGASRSRLARQLLTESMLLAILGAVLGLLLSQWATRALIAGSGLTLPSFVEIGAAPEVIAATIGLALLCGLAFGLAPLSVSLSADLSKSLTRAGQLPPRGLAGMGWHRFQSAVIVTQVALVLTLAVSAGLMTKGFRKLVHEDLGFRADNLLTTRIDLRGPKYVEEPAVTRMLREEYLPRIAALPGVQQVAMSNPTVPTDELVGGPITIEDHDNTTPDGMYLTMWRAVTPDYFSILGIPLLKGRAFNAQDIETHAVIVSKTLADRQWPGKDPIGRRLSLGMRGMDVPWLTVVGVVGDVRHEGFADEKAPAPDIYLSLLEMIRRPPLTVNFLVRPKPGTSIASLERAVHQELKAIEPELPPFDAAPLAERLAKQTGKARFQLTLISLFTALALVLAAIGIYGVVAYGVAQRRREIAIRLSLGADRGRILRLVVGRGALLAAIGLAVGLVAIFLLRGPLSGLLYQTSATDPWVLGGTSLVLFLITLVANYLPARRAVRQDPVAGLRLQ